MASKDLYSVLGVSRTASSDEIRSEYRKLARKLHPDVNPGDDEAEARFKEVSAAYSVLSDEKKRKLYDEFGDVALQVGFDEEKAEQMRRFGGGGANFDFRDWSQGQFAGGGLEELLGSLFGGRFGGFAGQGGTRVRHARKGNSIEAELAIDLPLSVRGGTTSVRLNLPGRELVEVKVPPGVKDGQSLRLSGLGQPGAFGGPAGDLLVRLRVLEHSCYRREGDDLHVEVPVTLAEALEGGKVSFQGPTGEVTLTIPPGTQSGQSFRLRGLGAAGRAGKGNLYARIVITSPKVDERTSEEARARLRELAQGLADYYPDDPRVGVQF